MKCARGQARPAGRGPTRPCRADSGVGMLIDTPTPTPPRTVYVAADGVRSGGAAQVRGSAVQAGNRTCGAVLLTVRVPAGFLEVQEDGSGVATRPGASPAGSTLRRPQPIGWDRPCTAIRHPDRIRARGAAGGNGRTRNLNNVRFTSPVKES